MFEPTLNDSHVTDGFLHFVKIMSMLSSQFGIYLYFSSRDISFLTQSSLSLWVKVIQVIIWNTLLAKHEFLKVEIITSILKIEFLMQESEIGLFWMETLLIDNAMKYLV